MMTPPATDPHVLDWRGFGEIWTTETYHLDLRRTLTLRIENSEIQVRSSKKDIGFHSSAVVEARSFRFPFPSMTLIFKHGNDHALVSLFFFPQHIRQQFSDLAGIEISDRRTWRTGFEAGRDQRNYSLQGSSKNL